MRVEVARCAAVVLLFLAARVIMVTSGPVVLVHADRFSYYHEVPRHSLIELLPFVSGAEWGRPPVYPMFLKLCGFDGDETGPGMTRSVFALSVLSVAAFAAAAIALSSSLRAAAGLRTALIAILFIFSLSAYAGPWDSVPMTESLNLTLFIFTSLATWSYLRAPGPLRLVAVLVCFTLLTRLRDANLFLPLCLVGALLTSMLPLPRRGLRRRDPLPGRARALHCALIAALLLLSFTSYRSAVSNKRDDFTLTHLLFMEVFTEGDYFDHFVEEYGMPDSVRGHVGVFEYLWWERYPEYMAWLGERSRSAYLSLLVERPDYTLFHAGRSARERADELARAGEMTRYFDPQGESRIHGWRMRGAWLATRALALPFKLLHGAGGSFALWTGFALASAALLVILRRREAGPAFDLTVFLLLVIANQYLMTSFFSVMENYRHGMIAHGLTLLILNAAIAAGAAECVSAARGHHCALTSGSE